MNKAITIIICCDHLFSFNSFHPGAVLGIPIRTEHVRSLNLSTAVGIAVYHALGVLDAAARARAVP